ncbi:MAG: non-heme iron oxygenase ferredoxin subunit [Pseudomonadota bacterium]
MAGWFNVASVSEFLPGQTRLIKIDNAMVAVFNLDGEFHAIEDICTHDGVPMLGCGVDPELIINGNEIICPRHGARFCIKTGSALSPPAYEPTYKYPTRIEDGFVQVTDDRGE